MAKRRGSKGGTGGRKVRVAFRPNRSSGGRDRTWTQRWKGEGAAESDSAAHESLHRGGHSRKRTVIEQADGRVGRDIPATRDGVVIAMRGLIAEVRDGDDVVPCTIRRVLRTRRIDERQAVTVGDRVQFSMVADKAGVEREGVIESVAPRSGVLQRLAGRRLHTLAANVDLAWIVSAAAEPPPKPHLIDRYLVAAMAGGLTPIVVVNKADLDEDGTGLDLVRRYADLGHESLLVSAHTGQGVDALRARLKEHTSAFVGQSGVGKSAMLNAIQPSLQLQTGDVSEAVNKGRHTTTTARLLPLDMGGYVVDTPGIRTFELPPLELGEIEAFFNEFVDRVRNCKYPNCAHVEEDGCAIRAAVESGDIHVERYESYRRMLAEG